MNKNNDHTGIDCLCLIVSFVILMLISPFINFCSGWITGQIVKITFGPTVIKGLSLIGLNITKESLPLLFGSLSVIGSFFCGHNIIKRENNN